MTKGNYFDLSGKVSVITGAGSGLGRAFCEAMAESGSDVVCVDKNEDRANETAQIILRHKVKALAIRGDVTNQEDVKTVFRMVDKTFGRLDVLFNNAGITSEATLLHEMPLAKWNEVINVNLTGVFLCMQEGIKLMIQKKIKGSVINISSVGGLYGMPGQSNYCASKAGVIALTRSASVDYGPYNIRVNAIAPGVFKGTMLAESTGRSKEWLEALYDGCASETPLRRVADVNEIKGLAIYLASDTASFTTGAVFVVDGGYIVNRST